MGNFCKRRPAFPGSQESVSLYPVVERCEHTGRCSEHQGLKVEERCMWKSGYTFLLASSWLSICFCYYWLLKWRVFVMLGSSFSVLVVSDLEGTPCGLLKQFPRFLNHHEADHVYKDDCWRNRRACSLCSWPPCYPTWRGCRGGLKDNSLWDQKGEGWNQQPSGDQLWRPRSNCSHKGSGSWSLKWKQ